MYSSIIQAYVSSGLIGLMTSIFIARSTGLILNDIRSARQNRHYEQNKKSRLYKERKQIHIIISTDPDAPTLLTSTLESIFKNNYRKYKVSILAHRNDEKNTQVAKHFVKKYPKKDIQIVNYREEKFSLQEKIMVMGRELDGNIILPLSAGSIISKTGLELINRDFISTKSLDILIMPIQFRMLSSLTSVRESFTNLLSKHDLSSSSSRHISVKENWASYDKGFFSDALHQTTVANIQSKKSSSRVLTSEVSFCEEIKNIQTIKKNNDHKKISLTEINIRIFSTFTSNSLLAITLLGSIGASVAWMSPSAFAITWTLFTVMTLLYLLTDRTSNIRHKVRMSLYLPIAYALFMTKLRIKN